MEAQIKNYQPTTILLVEDDDVDAMGIERALRKLKIANPVVRVRDGIEGLAALRDPKMISGSYIALVDINMPRMNGLEMLSEIRADPQLSQSVVFILTTSKNEGDKQKAYEKNVAGYIVKENAGEAFMGIVEMLDHYWRIVELPKP